MTFSSLAFGGSGLSPQKMNKNMGHSEINFLPWKINQFVGRPISGEIPHFRNSLCFLVATFRMMHYFYDIVFILTHKIIKESIGICVLRLHIKYLWPNKVPSHQHLPSRTLELRSQAVEPCNHLAFIFLGDSRAIVPSSLTYRHNLPSLKLT